MNLFFEPTLEIEQLARHTKTKWERWNQQGFIPGPDETEQAFIERVAFCQNLKQTLIQHLGKQLPFSSEDLNNPQLLEEAWPLTQKLYGIIPHWVPLFFNNDKLSPWHAGCAWIFQFDAQTPTAALLQLRKTFQTHSSYLGLYERKELLAHELAHIGRMVYEEPQFEEIFAYQSSSSPWRRWLGPIFQSEKETLFFIFVLFVPLIVSMAFALALKGALLVFLLPFAFVFFGLGRLFYRHQTLKRCKRQLEKLGSHSDIVPHFLYRLSDAEIKQFASLSPSEIKKWIKTQVTHSFRWHFLNTLYPLAISIPKESE